MVIIKGYQLDVAVSEDHSFDSEVTEHPVEKGADIADHVRARPITVSVEGIVSDTPIREIARPGFQDSEGDPIVLPSAEAYALLIDIRDKREPVTVQTSLQLFENMVLTSLSVPRSVGTGDALRFTATFVQIQLVTTERTVVRVRERGAKKVDLGNRPATPAEKRAVTAAADDIPESLRALAN